MRLWSFMLALALAVGLGLIIRQDPGYAFFAYHDWVVEMPLWICAVLFIVVVALSLLTLWTLNAIFSSTTTVKRWWKKHKERTARLHTYRGLLQLAEGRWESAERYLIQSAPFSDTPLINYLSAATAAEEAGSPERCNHYLQLAFDASADSDIAVRLTQAQFQLNHGEWEQSLATLEHLRLTAPKHTKVLRLLGTLYEAMQDYESLFSLLPTLQKTHALSQESLTRLAQKIYPALLPGYAAQGIKKLISFWEASPLSVQLNPAIVCQYAALLAQHADHNAAETVLRTTLKKVWHPDMVRLYGLISGPSPQKQRTFAESLLNTHSEDPTLLLTVGRLCLTNQLWGDARKYLERSLSLLPTPETYAELAKLMEQLELTEKRDEYFKKGLLLATQPAQYSPTSELLCITHEEIA